MDTCQEERECEYIKQNLPKLISLTTLNTSVLVMLLARGVISDNDMADLDAILNKAEKNRRFYDIIRTRPGNYDVLIDSMNQTCQNGVVAVLKKFYNPSFLSIFTTMEENTTIPKKKWHSIATGLQIPEEDIEDIQTAIKMDNLSKKDIFIKVLASWHQANDEDATVERLIDTLDGDNLKVCANSLRRRFKIMIPKNRRDFPSSKEQTNTKDQNPSSAKLPRKSNEKNEDDDDDEEEKLDKLVKAQNQFLLDKADELVELLDLNSTTIAKLLSKKVISKTDVSALDAIPNQLEKNRHFLVKILPSKHDYFTVFFNAMKDTAQSGVVAVLKKFYKTAK
ncbi:hypothetical protein Ocin01_14276 [Orchesella cincta]|uniref:Death domain-containing protein n=1 Tax=Orchesella cincta TaxID=48709 RepID=A0A1D2MHE6_ORCCI|nr:hypothetical protein Ocin01_14276 [Orchesella cincta]